VSTDILMECAKAGAAGIDVPPLRAAPEWRNVVATARTQGCLVLLAPGLRSLPGCPSDLTRDLARVEAMAWAQYTITAAAIAPVLRQACDQGLTIVVYKGAAQAARYYAQPWCRPMADVDILVRDREKERLHEILSSRGFRLLTTPGRAFSVRASHERSYAAPEPGARPLDIHVSPAPPTRYRLSVDEMIARASPGTVFDAPVRFLAPEDELLVTAVNQAYDHYRRGFLRYLDAWLVSRRAQVDWAGLATAARTAGAAAATWLTLSNARRLAGVAVPEETLAALQPSSVRRVWIRALFHTENAGLGEPRLSMSRRAEQLILVYPFIDRPDRFARFAALHVGLRLLDAGQRLISRVLGSPARPSGSDEVD
jgi:hypothetical protein